uniref:Uncharacterized protein n=1 Tax=Lutzomyia longipalpis TaxID=7200 RepID=A0A1B0CC01_LUTLO
MEVIVNAIEGKGTSPEGENSGKGNFINSREQRKFLANLAGNLAIHRFPHKPQIVREDHLPAFIL